MCPFRVSARSSLPTRIGHTKAAPSLRAGQPARNATRIERCPFPPCGRFARCRLSSAPFKSPHSPTAISPCAPPYKPECGVQSVRCEARTALISPRTDSTPPHLSAPGTGAHTTTLRLRHGTCFKRPGAAPGRRYAASGLSIDTLLSRALQRAVRIAAYCSNFHPCGVRFALATPTDRALSPSRHIAEVRTSPPQNGKYATARARKSLAPAHEPSGSTRAAKAASAPWVQFPQTRRPPVPFKRQELAYGSKPPTAVGAGGPQGACQAPPSVRAQNSAPTAVGTCYAR